MVSEVLEEQSLQEGDAESCSFSMEVSNVDSLLLVLWSYYQGKGRLIDHNHISYHYRCKDH